jgi:hypothetical protein
VIDAGDDADVASVGVGNTPDAVAVTPDQTTAVVTNEGDNTISIVTVATLARLWDQTGGATAEATNSQQYETHYSGYTDQAADDFQVAVDPSFTGWRITGVVAPGSYADATPPGPATSFNIYVYADNAATHLPGALVFSQTNIPQIPQDATGDVTVPLQPAVLLAPGHYWLTVQANETFGKNGAWFWDDRAPQTLSAAAWEQPGDSSRLGCPAWQTRDTCIPLSGPANPDQAFALIGGETSSTQVTRAKAVRSRASAGRAIAYSAGITAGKVGVHHPLAQRRERGRFQTQATPEG